MKVALHLVIITSVRFTLCRDEKNVEILKDMKSCVSLRSRDNCC